jgi:hypothetical protein
LAWRTPLGNGFETVAAVVVQSDDQPFVPPAQVADGNFASAHIRLVNRDGTRADRERREFVASDRLPSRRSLFEGPRVFFGDQFEGDLIEERSVTIGKSDRTPAAFPRRSRRCLPFRNDFFEASRRVAPPASPRGAVKASEFLR